MAEADERAYRAGLAAIETGDRAAIPALAAAAGRRPADPAYWQVLGLLQRADGDGAAAVTALDRAAALAPADAKVAHARALVLLESGLDAVAAFETALRLAPSPAEVLPGLAAALVVAGRREEAIARLDAELARQPHWFEGHWLAGRLKWMAGEKGNYLASLDRSLERAPDDLALWSARIAMDTRASRFDAVLATVARGRRAAGPNPLFDAQEAVALSELGDAPAADAFFQAHPAIGDLSLLIQAIRHELRSGRPERAAARAEPLLASPYAVYAWPYLSVAWRLLGDPRWQWLEGDPRLVGVYDLADSLPSLDALAERLRAIHAVSGHPLEQSVRGGTQTDGPLFARIEPEIRALRGAIVAAVERHVAHLPPPDPRHPQLGARRDRPVRFAGAWSIRLEGGGHHVNHVHPEGWFSSAFYVALPSEAERGAAPAGWLALGQPESGLGVDLPPVRLIEPKPGRLVLFPSTLWHGTLPFGSGERMTVAFDVALPA